VRKLQFYSILLSLLTLAACSPSNLQIGPAPLDSRYNDEQPALSGDGRWLAFVSNRNGSNQILLYNLQDRQFVQVVGLSPKGAIADSPSLSQTGRYIAYIFNFQGRSDLALYDRATRRSEILTRGYRSWLRNPHISPDGRYIVFETAKRGQWDLEVLDRGPFVELDLPEGVPLVRP
jgi:Tol biopolymer transport system component